MPTFQPFEMERLMSDWEQGVDYNLSESGVHPVALGELTSDPQQIEALLATELNYPEVNGTVELRQNIAALYPGTTPDNVLVTVGCAEANYISLQTVVQPGQEIAMMLPNYMQLWGLAHNWGIQVNPFHLRQERGWALDLAELEAAVTEKTKLIAVCNPNNPTGYILTEPEMEAIVAAAGRVGAWILADEVYSGAERQGDSQTPSFWGRYDKVLANNSLSKAYGLPGLRTGWIVGPPETISQLWRRHEYTTITTTMLANKLAAIALSPAVRPKIIGRTRNYVRRGFSILDEWLKSHGNLFEVVPPQAAAVAFVRYNLEINSTELVERLIKEKSVLVVPGDHFGMDQYLRLSFGPPPDYLRAGLARIHELVVEL